MVWERKFITGCGEAWENKKTKDILLVVHRDEWEVLLNGKILYRRPSEKEAGIALEEYILKEE